MSNQKKELEQHYLDTTYSIFIEDKQYDIKIGKILPPAIQGLINKESSAVILTAWNPQSQLLSSSANTSRNNQLNSKLKKYTVYKATGQGNDPSWPAEESYFILGLSIDEADKLAIEFEQYAYVWCENNEEISLKFTSLWYHYT